ncbi:hypothetical protein [Paracoccus homiensis]|uniref:Uncharacterized protein n=1 Tax=Paracoccus homiensis TaxID=364199 RepID=A0A1H9ZA49_9RHOB|nr:hypothetical protein [Paracoccus homiensis]SES78352.1 hypothetical protein SAMN04489858_101459 [Paracoccus homiensis]
MAQITALAVSEPVRVDARRVGDIVNELGESAAQNVIGLALEQLAQTLTTVDDALSQGDMAQGIAQADGLARLAWQVGLVSLAGVAMDLGHCLERNDMGAAAAVRARLMRIGNQSLTAIWDRSELG